MAKVVLYTRVSTEEQKDSGFSLQDQYKRLVKFSDKEGFDVVKHYQEDHSAKNFNRPKWKELISDLKEGKVSPKFVLIIRPDRFSRNMMKSFEMISLLRKYGVELKFLENDFNDDTPEAWFLSLINFAIPQMDNQRRSLNTKRGMRQAKREGRWNGRPPTGFKLERINGASSLVPNEKAPFIKKAFDLFATGIYSKEEVRRKLSSEGFYLSKNPFSTMLSNPVYIGKIKIKSWKEEPEEIVHGIHEGIIDEITFNKVQNIINNKRTQPFQKNTKDENLPLRGYLICRLCAGKLTGAKSKGNGGYYYYYKCQKGCKENFNATKANQIFEEYLDSFKLPDEIIELYMAISKDVFKDEDKGIIKEYNDLEKLIEQATMKIDSVEDKFISDDIDKETYTKLKGKYQEQRSLQLQKQNRLKGRKTNFQKYWSYGIPIIRDIGKRFAEASIEIKHKIIGSIFPENLIFEDQKYRTTKPSILLSLFTLNINDLEEIKKDVKEIISITSSKALPQGLEPWTL